MYRYSRQVAFAIFMLFIANSNCSKQTNLCCINQPAGSEMAYYCNNHRDAVTKFVYSEPIISKQRIRLNNFERFFNSIKTCKTIDCIETKMNINLEMADFISFYQIEHHHAEQEFQINENLKVGFIICGFEHAIGAIKQNLNQEGK